jgi:hypothetical protein
VLVLVLVLEKWVGVAGVVILRLPRISPA